MKRLLGITLAVATLALLAMGVSSQPPGEKEPPPKKQKKDGPPKKFELGKVLPPHIREELALTEAQEKELIALEKDVKRRLEKILTADQLRIIEEFRPKGPPDGKGPPKKKKQDDKEKD